MQHEALPLPDSPSSHSTPDEFSEEVQQIDSELRFAVDILQDAVSKVSRMIKQIDQRISRLRS